MLGIALVGVLSIGANSSFTNQALNIGETGGAPARPDYISFNKGDTGGVPVKPDYTRGDTGGAPADNRVTVAVLANKTHTLIILN